MKKISLIVASALMSGSFGAHAAIQGTSGKTPPVSGELFVNVFDSSSGKSYYKDLGITVADFLAGAPSSCFKGDFSADPNFAPLLSAQGARFSVVGVTPAIRGVDGSGNFVTSNPNDWGYLSTSGSDNGIFVVTEAGVDRTVQNIQGFTNALNRGNAYDVTQDLSGLFTSSDGAAYFDGGFFGNTINGSLSGDSTGGINSNVPFYFVNNNGTSGSATNIGSWWMSGGVVWYTKAASGGKGVEKLCSGGDQTGGGIINPTQPYIVISGSSTGTQGASYNLSLLYNKLTGWKDNITPWTDGATPITITYSTPAISGNAGVVEKKLASIKFVKDTSYHLNVKKKVYAFKGLSTAALKLPKLAKAKKGQSAVTSQNLTIKACTKQLKTDAAPLCSSISVKIQ